MGVLETLLSMKVIDDSIKLGERLKHIGPNLYNLFSLGVGVGCGSSATALVLTEHIKEEDKIIVRYAEQFEDHPDPQMVIDKIFDIHRQYHNLWIPIDGSARGFITSLKIIFGEDPHYERAERTSPTR